MANGYCQPILEHIEALSGTNPAKKLSPLGFTQMLLCCQDDSVKTINDGYADGHQRDVIVKYRKRPLESAISDTPNACDNAVTPSYNEFTLPTLLYREYSLYVPDSLIRQYCKDASEYVKLDANGNAVMQKETSVMREVYEMLVEGGGALLRSINRALVTQMSTQFGKNLVSGNNTATPVDFDYSTSAMQNALIKMIADWRENEFCDDVCIVGSGPLANLELIRSIFGNGAEGIDKGKLANLIPQVWFDKDSRAVWGADNIGVFEKGSLALITRNLYEGNFARPLANSNYFSMALPVNEYSCPQDCLDKLIFDVQVREIDCPTEMTINGGGSPSTVQQGVQIVISKYFNLFVKPNNLFDSADPLAGTNGTLRYKVSAPTP